MDHLLPTPPQHNLRPKRCRTDGTLDVEACALSTQDPLESAALWSTARETVVLVFSQHCSGVAVDPSAVEAIVSALGSTLSSALQTGEQPSAQELQVSIFPYLKAALGSEVDDECQRFISETLANQLVQVVRQGVTASPTAAFSPKELKKRRTKGFQTSSSDTSAPILATADSQEVGTSQALLPPPAPRPSVFPESSTFPCRVVAFHNLPPQYCEQESLKEELAKMCIRIPGVCYINVCCTSNERKAVVSFNTNRAAASVAFMVNSSGICTSAGAGGDGSTSTVAALPATPEEQKVLWEPLLEPVLVQERKWFAWSERYSETPLHELYAKWLAAKRRDSVLEETLQRLTCDNQTGVGDTLGVAPSGVTGQDVPPTGSTQEALEQKLTILQGRLECKNIIEETERLMRGLLGDSLCADLQHACSPPTYSSSNALLSNHRRAIFIRNLPRPLDDVELVRFLECVGLQAVHIWRDKRVPTTVCVELPSVGQVRAVLRFLDGTDMKFASATLSREWDSTS